jgi:hypothetical protein
MALELSDRSHAPAWERNPGRSSVLLVMTEIVWDGLARSATLRKEHKKYIRLFFLRCVGIFIGGKSPSPGRLGSPRAKAGGDLSFKKQAQQGEEQ